MGVFIHNIVSLALLSDLRAIWSIKDCLSGDIWNGQVGQTVVAFMSLLIGFSCCFFIQFKCLVMALSCLFSQFKSILFVSRCFVFKLLTLYVSFFKNIFSTYILFILWASISRGCIP